MQLRKVLEDYEGKTVQIGTQGSGYIVADQYDERLIDYLEHFEQLTLQRYQFNADKLRELLPRKKALLETITKKRIPDLMDKIEAIEKKQKVEKRDFLDCIDEITAKIEKENDRFEAQRQKWIRKFTKHHNQATEDHYDVLKDLRAYQDEVTRHHEKVDAELADHLEYLRNDLKKQENCAKSLYQTVQEIPEKADRWEAMVRDFVPFLDREVIEIYTSKLRPEETSILISGKEMGYFWDTIEFRKWRLQEESEA